MIAALAKKFCKLKKIVGQDPRLAAPPTRDGVLGTTNGTRDLFQMQWRIGIKPPPKRFSKSRIKIPGHGANPFLYIGTPNLEAEPSNSLSFLRDPQGWQKCRQHGYDALGST